MGRKPTGWPRGKHRPNPAAIQTAGLQAQIAELMAQFDSQSAVPTDDNAIKSHQIDINHTLGLRICQLLLAKVVSDSTKRPASVQIRDITAALVALERLRPHSGTAYKPKPLTGTIAGLSKLRPRSCLPPVSEVRAKADDWPVIDVTPTG